MRQPDDMDDCPSLYNSHLSEADLFPLEDWGSGVFGLVTDEDGTEWRLERHGDIFDLYEAPDEVGAQLRFSGKIKDAAFFASLLEAVEFPVFVCDGCKKRFPLRGVNDCRGFTVCKDCQLGEQP